MSGTQEQFVPPAGVHVTDDEHDTGTKWSIRLAISEPLAHACIRWQKHYTFAYTIPEELTPKTWDIHLRASI
jgi:hypothetical protein